jgi:hypothetical protein
VRFHIPFTASDKVEPQTKAAQDYADHVIAPKLLKDKMASTPTIPNPPAVPVSAKHQNVFVRFIDTIGEDLVHVLVKAEPGLEKAEGVAAAAEPFVLAFTPFGPEYKFAEGAIAAVQSYAKVVGSDAAMTNQQKFDAAVAMAAPQLQAILASKGITQDQLAHVEDWIQKVFNILAGPAATKAAS